MRSQYRMLTATALSPVGTPCAHTVDYVLFSVHTRPYALDSTSSWRRRSCHCHCQAMAMLGVGVAWCTAISMLGGLWVEGDRQSNLIKCIQFVCLSRIKLLGFACVRRTSNQCVVDRMETADESIPFVCLSVIDTVSSEHSSTSYMIIHHAT